jgi:hypothetical protein
MNFLVPATTASSLLTQQDLAVNQNFYGPNYIGTGANALALGSLRNPYLQQSPFLNANTLNSFGDLSTFGVGTDLSQAGLLSHFNQNNPALLQQAKNEVPLARIGLQQFRHQLAFQGQSEERLLGFQNVSEQRQLAFANGRDLRDLGLQEKQLQLLGKKDERGFWGNLIGTLAPALIGLFKNNQDGAREERMFKYAQQNKVDDVKDATHIKALKRRIAQLERKLGLEDDDCANTKLTKKKKTKHDDHKHKNEGYSSWTVSKKDKKDVA